MFKQLTVKSRAELCQNWFQVLSIQWTLDRCQLRVNEITRLGTSLQTHKKWKFTQFLLNILYKLNSCMQRGAPQHIYRKKDVFQIETSTYLQLKMSTFQLSPLFSFLLSTFTVLSATRLCSRGFKGIPPDPSPTDQASRFYFPLYFSFKLLHCWLITSRGV